MRRVLVTGARGFIGRHVAEALAGDGGFTLITSGRKPADRVDLCADLISRAQCDALLRQARPDCIVHAAGLRHGARAELVAANIAATRNLLWAAACADHKPRMVLVGSAAEYGPQPKGTAVTETAICMPPSAYGQTKLAATRLGIWFARHQRLDVTTLRLFNVVGPGMGGLPGDVVTHMANRPGGLDWKRDRISLPMVRDFIRVADVAEACKRALLATALPPIVNICTGVGRSFASLIDEMGTLAGLDLGRPTQEGPDDVMVGDPALCALSLGLQPSAELGDMLTAAIVEGRRAR